MAARVRARRPRALRRALRLGGGDADMQQHSCDMHQHSCGPEGPLGAAERRGEGMLTQKRASLFFSLSSSASAPPRGSSRASSPCAAACPRRMTTTMPSGTWAPGARPPPWALLVRGKGAEERSERPAAPCATWAGLRLHPLRSLVHPFVWRECAGPSVCCEAMVDAVPKLEEAGEGAAGYRDLETGRAVFAAGLVVLVVGGGRDVPLRASCDA